MPGKAADWIKLFQFIPIIPSSNYPVTSSSNYHVTAMFEQDIRLSPGTGTTTSHTLEILIMLTVAALIGLWLGWILWSRYRQEAEKLRLDNSSLTATAEVLRTELAALKTSLATAQSDNSNLTAQVVSLNRNNGNLRERVTELEDNLDLSQARNRTVETELGLSYSPDTPIMDDIPLEITLNLNEERPIYADDSAGVVLVETTSEDADDASSADIVIMGNAPKAQVIIESPEPEPTVSEPAVQPENAVASQSVPAPELVPVSIAASSERDDLTVVEGIGPKIQMLLNQYGIQTYHQLADTDVQRLKEILLAAGSQLAMHDPGTWPSQANLAANDQWDALKSIQGFLKGGKKPT